MPSQGSLGRSFVCTMCKHRTGSVWALVRNLLPQCQHGAASTSCNALHLLSSVPLPSPKVTLTLIIPPSTVFYALFNNSCLHLYPNQPCRLVPNRMFAYAAAVSLCKYPCMYRLLTAQATSQIYVMTGLRHGQDKLYADQVQLSSHDSASANTCFIDSKHVLLPSADRLQAT